MRKRQIRAPAASPSTSRCWQMEKPCIRRKGRRAGARSAGRVDGSLHRRNESRTPNAGWHGPENLAVPDGIRLVFQPAHSPELQPAEHLWRFVDEPLANRCFDTIESLDHAVGQRCLALTHQWDTIRDSTLFHWWPRQPPRT